MKIIFKKEYEYFDLILISVVLFVLSLIPCYSNGSLVFLRIPLVMVADGIVIYLLFRKELKSVTFYQDRIVVYFPILRRKIEFEYSQINEIIYISYIYKRGARLVIKLKENNNQLNKLIFEYYPKENDLFPFLEQKGFEIHEK